MWKHAARLLVILIIHTATLALADQPPWNGGKFVVYASPDDGHLLDTELIGWIAGRNIVPPLVDPTEIYLSLEPNYVHLYFPENSIAPSGCTPPWCGRDQGYGYWHDRIDPWISVIKLETGNAGYRPASIPPEVQIPTSVYDPASGGMRTIRVNDRIRIRGLFVVDYGHTMYYGGGHDNACHHRGLYLACAVHSELHPYQYYDVQLALPPTPGIGLDHAITEVLTVVAPRMPEVYSQTYWWNRFGGVAGDYVRDAIQTSSSPPPFFIDAPPMPTCTGTCELRYREIRTTMGNGSFDARPEIILGPRRGLRVTVTVNGTIPIRPMIYQGKFSVYWADTAQDPPPCGVCPPLSAQHVSEAHCSGSTCVITCMPGWNDCDHIVDNGCESNPATDFNNCGSCGHACDPLMDYACVLSQCQHCGYCGGHPCCPPSQCWRGESGYFCSDVGATPITAMPAAFDNDITDGGVNQSAKQEATVYNLEPNGNLPFDRHDVIFYDDFDRTTGLGPNWSVTAGSFATDGTFAISGSPLTLTNWAAVVPNLYTNDYAVASELILRSGGSQRCGLVARSAGGDFASDLYSAEIWTDSAIHLLRCNAAVCTEITTPQPAGIVPDTAYKVELVAKGANPVHLEVWLNDTMRVSYDDASPYQLRTGRVGIHDDSSAKYAAFAVYSLQ